jgi:hypothetical protein
MFTKTICAALATVALTVAPGVGTSTADAHPPSYYHYHHYHPPVYYRPYCPPTVVVVTPVCYQYEVFYRPNCNCPWQCGGTFASRYAAQARANYYQSQSFEAYVAMR